MDSCTRLFLLQILLVFNFTYSELLFCDEPKTSPLIKFRVIGGVAAQSGFYPWQAVLLSYGGGQGLLCGASVIDDNWLLTAAHCILPATERAFVLTDVQSLNDPGHTVRVKELIIHPHYDVASIHNDIALIRTSTNLLKKGVGRACLLKNDVDVMNKAKQAIVTGFGLHIETNGLTKGLAVSDKLLSASLPLIKNAKCRYDWQWMSGGSVDISTDQICAGSLLRGTAPGDSGGPLMVQDASGRLVQIGITSFGAAGLQGLVDQDTYPGIYTRVSPYIPWIESIVNATGSRETSFITVFFIGLLFSC